HRLRRRVEADEVYATHGRGRQGQRASKADVVDGKIVPVVRRIRIDDAESRRRIRSREPVYGDGDPNPALLPKRDAASDRGPINNGLQDRLRQTGLVDRCPPEGERVLRVWQNRHRLAPHTGVRYGRPTRDEHVAVPAGVISETEPIGEGGNNARVRTN